MKEIEEKQCMYNVTLSRVRVTILQCVAVELHDTVNYIKILSVAQQCSYGTFKSPATKQIVRTNF